MADEELEAPKLVLHTLCGEEIFYYFGTNEEASTLKNFNDIATFDGSAPLPQDIASCPRCGEKIMIEQLQVVYHKQKTQHVILVNREYIEAKAKFIEGQIEKRIKRGEDESFWSEINDTFGIRDKKTK